MSGHAELDYQYDYDIIVKFDLIDGFKFFDHEQYDINNDNSNGWLMEPTVTEMEKLDAALWASNNRIKLQKGVWSFEHRKYLIEPMNSDVRRRCFMKATQGGFTEMETNRSLHGMIFSYYSRGVLYLFPTSWDVGEFSKARFGPLIQANPATIGKYVQNTDTSSLKKIGEAFLYLRGASLTSSLDMSTKEASKLRSISVDKCVFDELDLMDPEAISKALGRMGDSDVKEEVYISNPTIDDFGIAKKFAESDKRYWYRTCDCRTIVSSGATTKGFSFSADLTFPDCVKYRDDGTGYVACPHCGKAVMPEPGCWVVTDAEKSDYMHGYHWSQLSSYQNDPGEILQQFTDPLDGNLGDVIRLRLGKPYTPVEDRLRVSDVYECCGEYPIMNSDAGPCAIGIDCQKPKRYVIGKRIGSDRYKIVRVGFFDTLTHPDPEWNEVTDLIRKFHIKSGVCDIRPYEDSARVFQKKALKMGCKVFLCEYKENSPLGTQYSDQTGIVSVNRTEIHDVTHRMVTTKGQLLLPRRCPEIDEFARQLCATAKYLDVDKRTKTSVYRYRGKLDGKPDDYRHALNYFALAAASGRIAVASEGEGRNQRQRYAINTYV